MFHLFDSLHLFTDPVLKPPFHQQATTQQPNKEERVRTSLLVTTNSGHACMTDTRGKTMLHYDIHGRTHSMYSFLLSSVTSMSVPPGFSSISSTCTHTASKQTGVLSSLAGWQAGILYSKLYTFYPKLTASIILYIRFGYNV